jgi:hypothetical protein
MSSFLYGRLVSKREAAPANQSRIDAPPGLKIYADVLTALVPAEVLAAHAIFVAAWTDKSSDTTAPNAVTIIDSHHSDFKLVFFLLMGLAAVIYFLGHIKFGTDPEKWDRYDFLRMLIPSAAFAGWSMTQRPSTMFDAAISISDGHKLILTVFGGIVLGLAAGLLGMKADRDPAGT